MLNRLPADALCTPPRPDDDPSSPSIWLANGTGGAARRKPESRPRPSGIPQPPSNPSSGNRLARSTLPHTLCPAGSSRGCQYSPVGHRSADDDLATWRPRRSGGGFRHGYGTCRRIVLQRTAIPQTAGEPPSAQLNRRIYRLPQIGAHHPMGWCAQVGTSGQHDGWPGDMCRAQCEDRDGPDGIRSRDDCADRP